MRPRMIHGPANQLWQVGASVLLCVNVLAASIEAQNPPAKPIEIAAPAVTAEKPGDKYVGVLTGTNGWICCAT